MKDILKTYILSNPNTWGRYLIKHKELNDFVNLHPGSTIAEKAFIAVNGHVIHNCLNCNKQTLFENFMKGYRLYCSTKCNQIHKVSLADKKLIARINALPNFELLSGLVKGGKFGRKTFTVRNKNCNHEFIVNNLDLFTNPLNYCPICGAKNRQKQMTNVNIKRKAEIRKHVMKITNIDFKTYSKITRTLTNKVIKSHNSLINPNKLKISTLTNHIDHIVSIYDGWINNIDPRLIASVSNLQILSSTHNLKKSTKSDNLKLESMIHFNKWFKKYEMEQIEIIDEIQFHPGIISLRQSQYGIALPCLNISDAIVQHSFMKNFKKYIFWGELADSAILNRFKYWNRINIEKVDARKCEIFELKPYECRKFLDRYHSQGFLSAKKYLGLKFKGKLVSVMTFGNPRFDKKVEWELLRFSSSINVRGGASKLFNHFIKLENPNSILSYSNKSYGEGNVYLILGFKHIHNTRPSKWYYSPEDPDNIIKTSSFKFANKNEIDEIQQKYVPFFNKGNDVFLWEKGI